jgi:hypothetical protein
MGRQSACHAFAPVWDEAKENSWFIVSMKDDWAKVFPFET